MLLPVFRLVQPLQRPVGCLFSGKIFMHLYIHIPFCRRICPYCAFYKHTPGATPMGDFVKALLAEARLRALTGEPLTTLYFGGGTPSMLSPHHFGKLMDGLESLLDFSGLEEFSLEANPATFTLKKAVQWRARGVTRVSLGVQTWEPELLELLGRDHGADQAVASVRLLREAGIPEINIDLMYALPGQTPMQWERTLGQTLALEPEHISAYSLTIERGTLFERLYGNMEADEELEASFYETADLLLTEAGYAHYETSNYALSGHRSLHNMAYWTGEDYIGLGPGACGTWERRRYRNSDDTAAYLASLLSGCAPPGELEQLSDEAVRTERLGLGLRTDRGIPLDLVKQEQLPLVNQLISEGMAERLPGDRLRLAGRGRLLADAIAVELL
ncbi:MAG: radical SAM family heme chaperone HemW [Akkermansia sp.]|nr:radical SAM family heme chaperone HemW [Akkermansia sp.]